MSNSELLSKTISEISVEIQKKSLSPVDLIEAQIQHIEYTRHSTNSFITLLYDEAKSAAKKAEEDIATGKYKGPLHGIPFGVKDNLTTAGIRTTAGSVILSDWIPEQDATVVAKMKEAGAILIGKENLCEFASGPTGYNPHYGNIHNPWDLNRISGGSSGGSGANVASFQTFVSFGTDAGGSVRIPASLCGLVGMKQTHGLVSLRGVLPPFSSVDHVGPITRCVQDSAMALQVIAGYDDLDPTSVPVSIPDYSAKLGKGLKGLVMGIPTNHYFDLVDNEVESITHKAIQELRALGVTVKEITINHIDHIGAGVNAEALVFHENWLRTRSDEYDPEVYYRTLPGLFARGIDVAKGLRLRRLLKMEFARVLREVDFIVTPTIPIVAFPIGSDTVDIKGEPVQVKGPGVPSKLLARNTSPTNQVGFPSITVPCGVNSENLPVGVQFIGRPFEESLILQVGYQYEQSASHWKTMIPTLVKDPLT